MKKLLSVMLVLILAASTLAMPTAAEKATPEENNSKISAEVKSLEDKYGIKITYPMSSNGNASISMNNLETLGLAFSSLTPTVVKQVSKYYEKRNGSKLDINYVFSNSGYDYNGGVLMAAFEQRTSKIFVYLPASSGKSIISGENPIALVHEFGHAFHLMCMASYGSEKMRSEWNKFNDGHKYVYSGFDNPDEEIFISGYAATSFEEDFAEVFAHTFVRNVPGTGFKGQLTNNSTTTGLGKKVKYIEKLLPLYLNNTDEAVENYRKIYSTPTTTTFEGGKFSGEYLQYIGYPQPRNVLKGILNGLDMTSEKSTWVRSLGAWRVIDTYGDMYYIFPGGLWSLANSQMAAA